MQRVDGDLSMQFGGRVREGLSNLSGTDSHRIPSILSAQAPTRSYCHIHRNPFIQEVETVSLLADSIIDPARMGGFFLPQRKARIHQLYM